MMIKQTAAKILQLDRANLWVKNSSFDFIFFLPIVPLLIFIIAYSTLNYYLGYAAVFYWVYLLLIRLPHFSAMLHVTWLNEETRKKMTFVKFYLVPALIFVTYWIPTLLNLEAQHPFVIGLTLIAHGWGIQHIAMQNYGILKLFRKKEPQSSPKIIDVCEKYLLLFIGVLYFVQVLERIYRFNLKADGLLLGLSYLLGFLIAMTFATWIFYRSKQGVSLFPIFPGTLHLIISCLVMFPWPMPEGRFDAIFYLYNFHHSLAYLGLIWAVSSNKIAHPQKVWAFYIPLVILGGLLILVSRWPVLKNPVGNLSVFYSFFVIHYYIEYIIWRRDGIAAPQTKEIKSA